MSWRQLDLSKAFYDDSTRTQLIIEVFLISPAESSRSSKLIMMNARSSEWDISKIHLLLLTLHKPHLVSFQDCKWKGEWSFKPSRLSREKWLQPIWDNFLSDRWFSTEANNCLCCERAESVLELQPQPGWYREANLRVGWSVRSKHRIRIQSM